MKLQHTATGHVMAVPSETLLIEPSSQYSHPFSHYTPNKPLFNKLRAIITETVKRKLRMGTKVFRPEGVERIFEHHFSIKEGEELLKASQCYISTTAGPILGRLFISTHKIAFCSEKPIKFYSKDGDCIKVHYKVVIPVGKLSRANESRNIKRPSEKYIEVVTVDNYDFWLLGVHSYQKTLRHLQQAKFQPQ